MADLEAQIQNELRQIVEAVTEITGLTSRWSGKVELVPEADFKGKKPFSCDILVDAVLATQQERWSTLIHEALHSFSVGYIRDDFQAFRGWEEGTVKQLQRLLRPIVFARLQTAVDEAVFVELDRKHRFNTYIDALEELRLNLNAYDVSEFYVQLLATPIRLRPGYVIERANQFHGMFRFDFVKTFSKVNAILIGRL